MARARNIKPGFYKNEDLAECSLTARFIFPGLWMLAVLFTVTLGPCWGYFEWLHWRWHFAQPAANRAARAITWDQIRFSVDASIALLLFARVVKLAVSVAIENWKRTRFSTQTHE